LYVSPDTKISVVVTPVTTNPDESFGGKRRYKRRLTLANQPKRKTKKNNKSRKIRKRRHYGGDVGMTTQVTINPIAYKENEDKEYTEMMALIKQH
jgi:hypothetical protein